MLKNIAKNEYEKAWKKWNGSPLQSWQWGDVKGSGARVERLGFIQQDSLKGIVTVFEKSFPFQKVFKLLGAGSFVYIPHGLCVEDPNYLKDFLTDINLYYKDKNLAFLLIDPSSNFLDKNWNETLRVAFKASGWIPSGATIQPNQTNLVDISRDEDELIGNLRPKWKRNINKAKRQGVTIREAQSLEDIKTFYKILEDVTKRGTFKIHPLEYFEGIWSNLSKDGLVKFYLAEKGNEALAGYMLLFSSKCAYEIYGGSTSKGRDLEAAYLVKFEMMNKARDLGKLFYDQWGVAPEGNETHPLAGISYFKSGFGGQYHQLLKQYAFVYKKSPYLVYKVYRKKSAS